MAAKPRGIDQIIGLLAGQRSVERDDQAARLQLRPDQEAGDQRHTRPRHHRLCQHQEMLERRPRRQRPRLDARRREPARPRVPPRTLAQQRPVQQIGRAAQPIGRQPVRRADRHHLLAKQIILRHAGPFLRQAIMDRRVKFLLREIERVGSRCEIHHQIGMQRAEARQARREPAHAETGQGRNPQRPLRPPRRHPPGRPPDPIERRADLLGIGLPRLVQLHPSPDPVEQGRLQPILQQRDLATDRALGQPHLPPGARKAAMGRGSVETVERAHRRQPFARPIHSRSASSDDSSLFARPTLSCDKGAVIVERSYVVAE